MREDQQEDGVTRQKGSEESIRRTTEVEEWNLMRPRGRILEKEKVESTGVGEGTGVYGKC